MGDCGRQGGLLGDSTFQLSGTDGETIWKSRYCISYGFLAFQTPPILQKQMSGVEEAMIDEREVEESVMAMGIGVLSHLQLPSHRLLK
jgi:hypothetical protein